MPGLLPKLKRFLGFANPYTSSRSHDSIQNRREGSHAHPNHMAIIMDGNGRWAMQRNLPRYAGHQRGAEATRKVVRLCREHGIPYLTLFAFSSENWERPADEVQELMGLLQHFLEQERQTLINNNIRLRVIGQLGKFQDSIKTSIREMESITACNDGLNLTVALGYGSRQEIIFALQSLVDDVQSGRCPRDAVDEQAFSQRLLTKDLPDPDLLIRTSGEMRLSNFLLWQMAYTELYFTRVLWPDFSEEDFQEALNTYATRHRRYGRS